MKRILILALTLMLAAQPCAALAEDVFTVSNANAAAAEVTVDRSYLRVTCPLDGEVNVVLTVSGPNGVVYQRNYGLCSGEFRSEDVYLPLEGGETLYQVSLDAGGAVSGFTARRVVGRLRDQGGCSAGYPLSTLSGANTWRTATLLDIASLEGGSLTVPLNAANGAYCLGTVTFSVSGGSVTVSTNLDSGVDGSVDGGTVYVATNALTAQTLGKKSFSGTKGKLNKAISLNGASYAAVYVKLTLSFDPATAPACVETTLSDQDALWQTMLTVTPNEAVG